MSKKELEKKCSFYKPACAAGCTKSYCMAFFPSKSPLVMEAQKQICLSDEHFECLVRAEGMEYQAKRAKEHKGCPFLTNRLCGHPNQYRCDGHTPPFKIEGDNLPLLNACLNSDYTQCPNYQAGVKFRELANRVKNREVAVVNKD